jgi:hypothetical protein
MWPGARTAVAMVIKNAQEKQWMHWLKLFIPLHLYYDFGYTNFVEGVGN